MSLSSKNFVKVNISHYTNSNVNGSRNVCVLIDANASISTLPVGTDDVWASVDDYLSAVGNETTAKDSALYPYILGFFNNGGQKLHFIKVDAVAGHESADNNTNATKIEAAIKDLPNDEIVIASTASNVVMQIVATSISKKEDYEGINEKVIVTYLHSLTVTAHSCKAVIASVQPTSTADLEKGEYYIASNNSTTVGGYLKDSSNIYTRATTYPSQDVPTYYIMKSYGNDAYTNPITGVKSLPNIIVKYGPQGIEMTVLAFLSQINVYRGTIEDYCYTPEVVSMFDATLSDGIDAETGVLATSYVDDDDTFEALKQENINCAISLASYGIMEYGGNKADGTDLVNDFIRIVLTQTLTDRVLGVLRNKLRYNQTGLSLVSGAISDELQKYKAFGYLSTDKVWDKGNLYDATNTYLIINDGTPVTQGYLFKILPFGALTAQDLANHLLPPIYLVIADSYSIRAIEITGRVF